MKLPGRRVLGCDTVNSDTIAAIEEEKPRSAYRIALNVYPPAGILRVSVNTARAYYGDILGILCKNESLVHHHRVALPGAKMNGLSPIKVGELTGYLRIFCFVCTAEKHSSLTKLKSDMALKTEWRCKIRALLKNESRAARHTVNGGLDSYRILGDTVADGSEVTHRKGAGLRPSGKHKLSVKSVRGYGVLCIGRETK